MKMRCPQCDFPNPEENIYCARCHSLLDLAQIPEVYPPRAQSHPQIRKLRLAWRRRKYRMKYRVNKIPIPPSFFQVIASFLMPGLGQILKGEQRKGYILFLSFIFFILLNFIGLLFFSNILRRFTFMVAISIHGYSVIDNLRYHFLLMQNSWKRFFASVFVSIFVFFLINSYYRLVTNATIRSFQFSRMGHEVLRPILDREDLVLVNKRVSIKRGDIVVFNGKNGTSIERIIGTEGDFIEFQKGRLFINNQEVTVESYPLYTQKLPENYIQKVPDNNYLLLETYHYRYHNHSSSTNEFRSELILVSRNSIVGKVIRVGSPSHHYWRVLK